MGIRCKDFFSTNLNAKPYMTPQDYQTYQKVAHKALDWVEEKDITVINIETLVMPFSQHPESNEEPETGDRASVPIIQFIRVWYQSS